jgi:hypothetical protein
MEADLWRGSPPAVLQQEKYGALQARKGDQSLMLAQGGSGKDTVRPMTIKQILDAQQPHPDAEFRSDGEPFSQV